MPPQRPRPRIDLRSSGCSLGIGSTLRSRIGFGCFSNSTKSTFSVTIGVFGTRRAGCALKAGAKAQESVFRGLGRSVGPIEHLPYFLISKMRCDLLCLL